MAPSPGSGAASSGCAPAGRVPCPEGLLAWVGEGWRGRRGVPRDLFQSNLFCYTQVSAVPLLPYPGAAEMSADTQGPFKGKGSYRVPCVGPCTPMVPTTPSTPPSPPCNRVGIGGGERGLMRKRQTSGETAAFPLTPRGTRVHPEPGQMRASLLLASFHPQTYKDGQGKHPSSPHLLFHTFPRRRERGRVHP